MGQFFNLPNLVTMTGIAAGVGCALSAAAGAVPGALALLIVAGICDLFDGLLARRVVLTDQARLFGARLDSIADMASFGLAPSVLLYAAGLQSPLEVLLLILFTGCAAWRLAYFDTVGMTTTGTTSYYTGLPTTYVALVLPLMLLSGFLGAATMRVIAIVTAVTLAAAMVSSVKIPKPRGIWYLLFPLLAVVLLVVYVSLADRWG